LRALSTFRAAIEIETLDALATARKIDGDVAILRQPTIEDFPPIAILKDRGDIAAFDVAASRVQRQPINSAAEIVELSPLVPVASDVHGADTLNRGHSGERHAASQNSGHRKRFRSHLLSPSAAPILKRELL
jgi:hypothetical protein